MRTNAQTRAAVYGLIGELREEAIRENNSYLAAQCDPLLGGATERLSEVHDTEDAALVERVLTRQRRPQAETRDLLDRLGIDELALKRERRPGAGELIERFTTSGDLGALAEALGREPTRGDREALAEAFVE